MNTLVLLKIIGGFVGALIGAAGGFTAGAKALPKILRAWKEMTSLFSELHEDDDE